MTSRVALPARCPSNYTERRRPGVSYRYRTAQLLATRNPWTTEIKQAQTSAIDAGSILGKVRTQYETAPYLRPIWLRSSSFRFGSCKLVITAGEGRSQFNPCSTSSSKAVRGTRYGNISASTGQLTEPPSAQPSSAPTEGREVIFELGAFSSKQ